MKIMCTGDVTPYLEIYDNSTALPITADFNTQHKCRNFDKIQDWQRTHLAHPDYDAERFLL